MPVYMIVDTKIKNPEAYEEYKIKAKPIVESFGGEYLARGGYTSAPETELWTPTRLVIVRFPSRKDVEAFLDSEEYAPIKNLRNKYADCTLTIIDGV